MIDFESLHIIDASHHVHEFVLHGLQFLLVLVHRNTLRNLVLCLDLKLLYISPRLLQQFLKFCFCVGDVCGADFLTRIYDVDLSLSYECNAKILVLINQSCSHSCEFRADFLQLI